MSTALSPIAKKRMAVYNSMPEPLQKLANSFEGWLGKGAAGLVMISYDMGKHLVAVTDDTNRYGVDAVKKLADYLNIENGDTKFYQLRNFASRFDRKYVEAQCARQMSGGGYLQLAHWHELAKLGDPESVDKMLDKVLLRNLSYRDLENEIKANGAKTRNTRTGGRKPKTPTSAVAGLQKTCALAQRVNNFSDILGETVFDAIEEMEPDRVSPQLLSKLVETREMLSTTETRASEVIGQIDKSIARVEKVLKAKAETADEEAATSEPTAKKKKKKARASAAAA